MIYTEEDTFKSLKRIHRAGLERILGNRLVEALNRYETLRVSNDLINAKEMKRHTYMKLFLPKDYGPILIHLSPSRSMIKIIYEPSFEGTGWSVDDYCDILYKEALERHKEVAVARKRILQKEILLFILLVLFTISISAGFANIIPTGVLSFIFPIVLGLVNCVIFVLISNKINKRHS